MGIVNIHYLFEPDDNDRTVQSVHIQAVLRQSLVEAHRRGEHPYGSMRRECPLCQLGK
jgi:DNA-binding helix-hairpin-helix protein with protein kinase domain